MLKTTIISAACLLAVLFGGALSAQNSIAPEDLSRFHTMEDSMLVTIDSMYEAYIPDTHTGYCERFVKQLVRALKMPNSYYFPFDKLKDKINIIYPDDNAFRVFNWVIATSPVEKRYYGAVQLPAEQLHLYPLVDYTAALGKGAEDSILTNYKWFGALYYNILPHEIDGKKVYTMLGINAASSISNKKVMDPMMFTSAGLVFGAPIFNVASQSAGVGRVNRFIIEYKKEVQASMNWDAERKLVVFDRLVSQVNDPNRKYTFVPSGQYDGFKWENDQWTYVQDLIPVQNLKDGEAPSATDAGK